MPAEVIKLAVSLRPACAWIVNWAGTSPSMRTFQIHKPLTWQRCSKYVRKHPLGHPKVDALGLHMQKHHMLYSLVNPHAQDNERSKWSDVMPLRASKSPVRITWLMTRACAASCNRSWQVSDYDLALQGTTHRREIHRTKEQSFIAKEYASIALKPDTTMIA